MEMEEINVDLSGLCRTCNTECSHTRPLFARESDPGNGLDVMLMSCTNLKILEADGLPNSICDRCVAELKSAYRFKQQCELTDWYYKRLGLKSNSDRVPSRTYDYVEIVEDNSIVFRCRECCWAFDTIRELKNHKLMHSKNEIKEEKQESLNVTEPTVFMDGENEENEENEESEENEEKQDEEVEEKFFLQFEMVTIPTETTTEQHGNSLTVTESLACTNREIKIEEDDDVLEVTKETELFPNSSKTTFFSCDVCGKSFSKKPYLQRHKHTHANITTRQRFKCEICDKLFVHSWYLKAHERSHNENERFKCDICEKSYSRKTYLRRHEQTHSENGRKPFKCDTCEKSYSHSWDLRAHARTHNENERFKCDICEKSYAYIGNLREHKRTHSENERFKCDICEKSYAYVGNLREHKLTHHENERFKCDVCEKSFAYVKSLREHKRTHNENERFKCDVCEKSYAYASNLREHVRTHHANERFKCDVCDKSFAYVKSFRRHKCVPVEEMCVQTSFQNCD